MLSRGRPQPSRDGRAALDGRVPQSLALVPLDSAFPSPYDGTGMGRNQRLGHWGEEAAADYLAARGYEIIDRNVRTPYGEIDLVARREGVVAFVEVKSRASRTLGPPEIAVTPRKRQHMLSSAAYYAQENEIEHWQIDVIAVQRTGPGTEITHFENAVVQLDGP